MLTEKILTKVLQELQDFNRAKPQLEQYCTPPGVAAHIVCENIEHIQEKKVLDLGAGTGMLGIATLLAGAQHLTFIEKDEEAVAILKKNLAFIHEKYDIQGTYEILAADLQYTDVHAQTTIMNPPFGTRNKHADTHFLDYASTHSETIISLHKTSTKEHIHQHIQRLKRAILTEEDIQFSLKHTMEHHTKNEEKVAVTLFVIK